MTLKTSERKRKSQLQLQLKDDDEGRRTYIQLTHGPNAAKVRDRLEKMCRRENELNNRNIDQKHFNTEFLYNMLFMKQQLFYMIDNYIAHPDKHKLVMDLIKAAANEGRFDPELIFTRLMNTLEHHIEVPRFMTNFTNGLTAILTDKESPKRKITLKRFMKFDEYGMKFTMSYVQCRQMVDMNMEKIEKYNLAVVEAQIRQRKADLAAADEIYKNASSRRIARRQLIDMEKEKINRKIALEEIKTVKVKHLKKNKDE